MKQNLAIRLSALAALLSLSAAIAQADDIRVRVNGDPVQFEGTRPRQMDGRVLVPLRGVLEKMGATVDWLPATQTVVAAKGDMEINLPIGSHTATVNGRQVHLDVPATTVAGSTMVPLRFVSEALGADVNWSSATQTVMIDTDSRGIATTRPAGDERYNNSARRAYRNTNARRISISSGTVIPVTLDERLSSNENRAGDRFTATVENGRDNAGLPDGTKFEGVVREAVPSRNGKPGVLDVDFTRIIFPNGTERTIEASLNTLDSKGVSRDSSGRLSAKSRSGDERLKWVGIGAGAGLLISTLTKGNTLVDTILGAGAGYLYNEVQRKGAGNVDLKSGSEFGVRMDRQFAFNPNQADR